MKGRPPGYHDVVKANWRHTKGYLLAGRDPCIRIRDDEVTRVKRALVAGSLAELPTELPKSWVMAVLVCPGDSVEPVAKWARTKRLQGSRVWFFLHSTADVELLRPWRDAGFRTDQAYVVDSWEDLHRRFGLALNDQVYADFKP